MPISPFFNPSTGASGGSTPSVSAPYMRSLGNLNGGSYTFTDTAAVALNSYAYNAGTDTHTFNVNTIGVANETYSMISGANFTSPKWRAPLTYADGTPVLVGDAFSLDVRMDNMSVGASRQFIIGVAVVENASSTVIGTMKPSGIYALTTTVGTPGMGVIADNLGAAGTVTGLVSGVGSTVFTGGSALGSCGKAGGAVMVRSATTVSSNIRQDGNTWASAASTQLALIVFVSTNGTVTTTGGQFDVRIKYGIAKLS